MQWDKSERNTSEKSTFSNLPKLEGEPPQIGGSAVSRSRGLENNFFFTSETIFWKFTHSRFQKCPIFRFSAIFGWETGCQRKKSAFWPLRSPNPLPAASGLGNQTIFIIHWCARHLFLIWHWPKLNCLGQTRQLQIVFFVFWRASALLNHVSKQEGGGEEVFEAYI